MASADELLVRYRAAQRLHDSLRSHQNMSESRLTNLRAEHKELSGAVTRLTILDFSILFLLFYLVFYYVAAWGEAQLVSTAGANSEQSSPSEREVRYKVKIYA